MKTMILVALAVLSLGVSNAYAQGKPLSSHVGVYGSNPSTPILWNQPVVGDSPACPTCCNLAGN